MKLIKQLLWGIAIFMPVMLFAQTSITGKVTDASGMGLPGVTVLEKGTQNGTATDFDGNFTLEVANDNAVLIFSFIGYQTQELPASDGMQVVLQEEAQALGEIVLIGYGTTTKKDATGAVEKVGEAEFNPGAIASPEQLITGKTAGVNVVPPSGRPGETGVIKIRGGVSSLSASNAPLIVIDGVPVDQNGPALNSINPGDIESFSILKDASATAIYGSRATNGVILITTKSGKMNADFKVNFDTYFSVGKKVNTVNVLSRDQFVDAINNLGNADAIALLGDDTTDWQEEIYRTAFASDNNLTVSEGFENTAYRIGMGYMFQEGILKESEFKRRSASINLRQNLFDNSLKMDFNIRASWIDDRFADQGAIGSAVQFDPTKPVYSGSDLYGGYWEWLNDQGEPLNLAPLNPLGLLEQNKNNAHTQRYIGNAKFDYSMPFVEGLSLTANFGFDYNQVSGRTHTPGTSAGGFYNGGTDGKYGSMRRNVLADVYLKYNNTFNDVHKLDIMAGQSFQDFYRENQFFGVDNNGAVSENQFASTNALLSYMARINYGFDNRYLVTFTFRRDGSSRFAPENRWGNFYSGALAWNIAEESFLKDNETISTLKLRFGYGETGQQEIGVDFGYLPVYTPGQDNVRYQFGDNWINTIRPSGYDKDIKWESSATWNVGMDYGFADDRIWGSVEYFSRSSTDILNTVAPPAGSNLTNSLYTNIGDLSSRGAEFSINADIVQQENLTWNVAFNATWLENKIEKLNAVDDPDSPGVATGGISGGVGNTVQTHKVGYPQSSFLVYKQVYDANGNPLEGVYEDINNDGVINDQDKVIFHNPNPDYLLGFSSYLNWGNWELNFTMRASLGNYVYNNVASSIGNEFSLYTLNTIRNVHASYLDTGFEELQLWSSYYVQDASFLKMDNVTLGYTFDELNEGKANLRLYGTVQNVFTITGYDGLDPEINGGIDNNFYPRPRTFLAGLSINF